MSHLAWFDTLGPSIGIIDLRHGGQLTALLSGVLFRTCVYWKRLLAHLHLRSELHDRVGKVGVELRHFNPLFILVVSFLNESFLKITPTTCLCGSGFWDSDAVHACGPTVETFFHLNRFPVTHIKVGFDLLCDRWSTKDYIFRL